MLLALYRANEDAFIRKNVNLVRAGRILNIPDADSVGTIDRSEAHTSELQSPDHLVCLLLLDKKPHTASLRTPLNRISTKRASHSRSVQHDESTSACYYSSLFFFNDTATTEIYTLSLHDALPI